MSKLLAVLVAAASIAGAVAVTASPANAQWGGGWQVGGDYYPPSGYGYGYGGYGYGVGVVPATPYAIVAVPTVPAIAVPAVPAVPSYGYGYGTGYGYSSAGYSPYGNLYSYAPGYYRRWYWQ
jgi:hypothetical protein